MTLVGSYDQHGCCGCCFGSWCWWQPNGVLEWRVAMNPTIHQYVSQSLGCIL